MGIKWLPLTPEQQRGVLASGERVWTEVEVVVIRRNASFYESVHKLALVRCHMGDCGYAIQDAKTAFAVPDVGVVCAACWEMYKVIRQVNINRGSTGGFYGR